MNICTLLSTKEREHILNDVLFKQDHISVVDVSRSLNVSKGFVSRFFSLLSKERLIEKDCPFKNQGQEEPRSIHEMA